MSATPVRHVTRGTHKLTGTYVTVAGCELEGSKTRYNVVHTCFNS